MSRLEKLKAYEKELIQEEADRTKPEFVEMCASRIEHCLSIQLLSDFIALKEALQENNEKNIQALEKEFLEQSEEYAKPWWDEDLNMERAGEEWEAEFYKKLADICKDK